MSWNQRVIEEVSCPFCKALAGVKCADKGNAREKAHPSRITELRIKDAREDSICAQREAEEERIKTRWPDGEPSSWEQDRWYRVCDKNTGEVERWVLVLGEEVQGQRDVMAIVEEKAGAFRWSVYFPWTGDDHDIGYEKSLWDAKTKAEEKADEAYSGFQEEDEPKDAAEEDRDI